jgi:hypothetical protein
MGFESIEERYDGTAEFAHATLVCAFDASEDAFVFRLERKDSLVEEDEQMEEVVHFKGEDEAAQSIFEQMTIYGDKGDGFDHLAELLKGLTSDGGSEDLEELVNPAGQTEELETLGSDNDVEDSFDDDDNW